MWYVEAGKYNVLPIDGSAVQRLMTERPQIAEPRDQLHLPARHPDRAVLRRPAGAQPPARHHRRRGDPGRRRRGRAALPGHQRRRLVVLRQGRQAALRPQLRRAARSTRCRAPDPLPAGPAPAAVRVRAHRHSPTSPRARAPPAGPSCTSTASSSAQTEFPVTTPIAFNPGGAHLRRQPRLGGHHRLPGPVPLHRHPAHRHRRPVRRPDHRHRGRDAHGHGRQ